MSALGFAKMFAEAGTPVPLPAIPGDGETADDLLWAISVESSMSIMGWEEGETAED